jgi:hypothetical protein
MLDARLRELATDRQPGLTGTDDDNLDSLAHGTSDSDTSATLPIGVCRTRSQSATAQTTTRGRRSGSSALPHRRTGAPLIRPGCDLYIFGWMFWLTRKTLPGSYVDLTRASRS